MVPFQLSSLLQLFTDPQLCQESQGLFRRLPWLTSLIWMIFCATTEPPPSQNLLSHALLQSLPHFPTRTLSFSELGSNRSYL